MRALSVVCLLLLMGMVVPIQAQQKSPSPLVVFIEDQRFLNMSSVTDNGPDGLTRLADLFRAEGARTTWVHLRDGIPADASVVVLVRPRRPLTPQELAELWLPISNGASLLIALDPMVYLGTGTESEASGLNKLTTEDQGVSLLNGIMVEPWFTINSFKSLYATFSFGFVDPVPNPVSDPLRQYDLPVALWGARPLHVEPFGIDSFAWALVDATPQYVETALDIFPVGRNPGKPFGLNIGKDYQGQFPVVGMGENTRIGSRIVMIGDGEMLQNGYGLSRTPDGSTPAYPANYVLTQRLAAWLLRLPEDQYPALPSGVTWIAIDGQTDDWPSTVPVTSDSQTDASILALNIKQVRAFRNDSYLYLAVETAEAANPDSQIDLEVDTTGSGKADTQISMQPGHILAKQGTQAAIVVPDAAMAMGDAIEARLPLRITGQAPHILNLCLSSARKLAFPQPPDCLDTPARISRVAQVDPAPLRDLTSPLVALQGDRHNRINVRATPSTSARVLTTQPYGTVFAAIGRTQKDDWIEVQNAAYRGWVFADSLFATGDLAQLPVTG